MRLRELLPGDAEFILRLVNSPGWLEFIGNRNIHSIEDARNYMVTGPFTSYVQHGYGLYMVELRSDQSAMGLCGLVRRDYLPSPDLGFAFLPEFQGKGYALEAATATISYAAQSHGLNDILAITTFHNQRSISLLNKLGMKERGTVTSPSSNEQLLLFGLPAQ